MPFQEQFDLHIILFWDYPASVIGGQWPAGGETYLYTLIYTKSNPIDFQQNAVWTKPDSAGIINAYQLNQFTVVNDLKDIINPQAIILPISYSYKNLQPDFTFANYQVYLPLL